MDKFRRNYELTINFETGDTLTIRPPFTLEFNVVRSILSSANVCQLRVYNLSKLNRNRIRFNISNYGTYRGISLKAGYGDNISEIFRGNISQAWSVREVTDWITQIECYDGGFAFTNAITDASFVAGTPERVVFGKIIKDLPHVSEGAIGNFFDVIPRGNSYSGSTKDILSNITGGAFFVDSEKANILKTNEYYTSQGGKPLLINASSGLLSTPIQEQTIVRFEMLLEAQLNIGSAAFLDSITGDNFNGLYKITAISHRGVISDVVSGTAVTTGEFFYDKALIPVPA